MQRRATPEVPHPGAFGALESALSEVEGVGFRGCRGRGILSQGPMNPHPTKLLPLFSRPNQTTVASRTMFTISNAASAHAYPNRSRSAYSIVFVGAANRIPS